MSNSPQPSTVLARQIYGPVPSRRLGTSLGVDLVPFKVCSYDCVYCQLGRTRWISCDREAFVPPARLVEEIRQALVQGPLPDVITLAGSGEPTLYEPLGELIRALKTLTGIPVALLTNGALFWKPEVRRDAALADLVLPSLDAGDEATFQAVNRPHPGLTLEETLQGLEARGIPSPAAAPISLLGERLRELLARRPCTVEDASRGLSVAPAEVSKVLAMLLERGQARREPQGELTYS